MKALIIFGTLVMKDMNMNQIAIPGMLAIVGLLSACGSTPTSPADSSISSDQLEKRTGGLFYKEGTDELFTGQVIDEYRYGQARETMNFVDGIPDTLTKWYESGQKQSELQVESYESGHVSSHMTEWYESGQMKLDQDMLEGTPDGLVTKWHENGQIESQQTFVNGRSVDQKTWDESGADNAISLQIDEGVKLASGAQAAVREYFLDQGLFPENNQWTGLAPAEEISGKYVESLTVHAYGKIVVRFGNDANAEIFGKSVTLKVIGAPPQTDDLLWSCFSSNIDSSLLSSNCQFHVDDPRRPLTSTETDAANAIALQNQISVQIDEGLKYASVPKLAVNEFYQDSGMYPENNQSAGLAPAEAISGKYVESVTVEADGKIVVRYGNDANTEIFGKSVILKVVGGLMFNNLDWNCSSPNIDSSYLPISCR